MLHAANHHDRSLCCVMWLCYYVIGVNYWKTIRPPRPRLSSLMAQAGNHCSWSNRCLFSQSTSWQILSKTLLKIMKHSSSSCHIPHLHLKGSLFQFWYLSQVSHCVTQRSVETRENWQHIPDTAEAFISALSRERRMRECNIATLSRSALMTHYIARPGESEGNSGNVLHFLPIELMRPNLCIWPFCKFCIGGGCRGKSDIFI